MDRSSRDMFFGLPARVGRLVLCDALVSKVADMDLGPAAEATVAGWRRSHSAMAGDWQASPSRDRPGVRPSQLRRILGCLSKMHVEDICRVARRFDGEAAAALEHLLAALRSGLAPA